LRCWYCYVPFELLAGNERRARWVTADELVELYATEAQRPLVLDLSGGSPDLAPEWIAWTMDALQARGLASSCYLWSDDNLSNDLLLGPEMRPVLRRIEAYRGYGRTCCLKGFDGASFEFTTSAAAEDFERQMSVLLGYLSTEMDLYAYITLVAPSAANARDAIRILFDRFQHVRAEFVGRIVPLRIERFGSMLHRLDEAREYALQLQDEIAAIWLEEIGERGLRPIWSELTS
jgi:uncharacterized Fe-S cluster-containing radical SAM superfamily protein